MTTQDENENPIRVLCTEITNDFTPKITTVSYKGKVENGVMIDKVIDIHNSDSNAHSAIVATLNNKDSAQDIEIAKKVNTSSLASVAISGAYNDLTDKPALSDVAISGSYNDLSDTPTIPSAQVNSDWNAQSGAAEILNKPSIPTKTSDLTNDSGFIALSTLPFHELKSYVDEGELLTDAEGLKTVTSYAHSTYDSSKFIAVNSPTVSEQGIISGFSTSNYLTADFALSGAWKFTCKFNLTNITDSLSPLLYYNAYNQILFNTDGGITIFADENSTTQNSINLFDNNTISVNINYLLTISFDGTSTYSASCTDLSTNTVVTDSDTLSKIISTSQTWYIGSDSIRYIRGSVDLKYLKITDSGTLVFSGNQTGTATYTINGSTVNIPYTLSKTGSKIVDSAYRTQVENIYNEFGCAPYYTLNEGVNFTLPQGELYGMIGTKLDESAVHIKETYKNGSSWYRVYSDGWCEQGGYLTNTLNSAGSVTLTLLKSFADTNYSFHRSPVWVGMQNVTSDPYSLGCLSKTASTVTFASHTTGYVTSINWYACGYVS